jgi:hypothetical protein
MKKLSFLTLSSFLFFMSANCIAETDVNDQLKTLCSHVNTNESTLMHYKLPQVMELIENEGYKVEGLKDDHFSIKKDGRKYIMYYFDGDLQLYYGLTGIDVSYKTINEWNRTKRLSRAYLDTVKDPALEADLDGTKGLTDKQIIFFTKVFLDTSAPSFRKFLLENGTIK